MTRLVAVSLRPGHALDGWTTGETRHLSPDEAAALLAAHSALVASPEAVQEPSFILTR